MREKWAKNIAFLTGCLVVFLAIMFARIQNPSESPQNTAGEASRQPPAVVLTEADLEKQELIAAGRRIYEAQRCARCHSINGEGNLRYPLDGVRKRRTADEIRQWILAPAELKDKFPAGAFQVKQAYRNLPVEDIDAVVAYLQSL